MGHSRQQMAANQGKSLNTVGGEAALKQEIAEHKQKPKVLLKGAHLLECDLQRRENYWQWVLRRRL